MKPVRNAECGMRSDKRVKPSPFENCASAHCPFAEPVNRILKLYAVQDIQFPRGIIPNSEIRIPQFSEEVV